MLTYFTADSTACALVTSQIVARPVSSEAVFMYLKPSSSSPWKEYGEVRGLYAPPRRMVAPAFFTALAMHSNCSSVSTAHGPDMIVRLSGPINVFFTAKDVGSGWNFLFASL